MIICNQCGAALKDGARFCNECGAGVPGAQPHDTHTLDETLVRPPVTGYPPREVVNTQPLGPGRPRASVAVPLIILGVILGGGFLLLIGISASRSNSYNSYNSYTTNTNGYSYNSTNTANSNYSTNTGNMNSNRGNTNGGYTTNTNTGGYTSTPSTTRSGFDYVEGKILNNSYITSSDLTGLSLWQLRLLRNTVFAKYGRTYPKPEDWSVQQHFNSRSWYSPNENYNSNQQYVQLTPADEANLAVIKQAEGSP